MLIAEELLLMALDPVKGAPVNSSTQPLRTAMCGALVAELGLDDLVSVDDKRFVALAGAPAYPLLADTLTALGANDRRRSTSQLRRLDRAVFVPVTRYPVLASAGGG